MVIPNAGADVPFITEEQMREVDRAMVEDLGILLVQMMEHAGRGLAAVARSRFFAGDPRGKRVLVLAGSGGNGGGGLVAARWLHNWGATVQVRMTAPARRMGEVPRHQLQVLQRIGVDVSEVGDAAAAEVAEPQQFFRPTAAEPHQRGAGNADAAQPPLPPADLVLDAIIGYSLRGAPSGAAARAIRAANHHSAPVLALDVPSGVDSTTGAVHEPAIRAAATFTLALPKIGLKQDAARRAVGELYLGDIGVPPELYARPPLKLTVGPVFAQSGIVRLW